MSDKISQVTQIIQGNIANNVILAIKDNLHSFIVTTLMDMLRLPCDTSTENIIKDALSLWLCCCLNIVGSLTSFLNSEIVDAEGFMLRGLSAQSLVVRNEFYHTFYALAMKGDSEHANTFSFILRSLHGCKGQKISSLRNDEQMWNEQFFVLLVVLLKEFDNWVGEGTLSAENFDNVSLYENCILWIKEHKKKQSSDS